MKPAADPPASGPGLEPPLIAAPLRVLYLFAGHRRRATIREALGRPLDTLPWGRRFTLDIFRELDILQDASHDLLDFSLQAQIIGEVESGVYHLVIASPPCETFSRARHSNRRGPPPVRSREYPRGVPWLAKRWRQQVEAANALVTFSAQVMAAAATANVRGHWVRALLEHPEDLGLTNDQVPASIFQWPIIKDLVNTSKYETFAFWQCHFKAEFAKPTRLISNIADLSCAGFTGWPISPRALPTRGRSRTHAVTRRTRRSSASPAMNGRRSTPRSTRWP